MSEQMCHLYFQMVCQKLCQNSVPEVGITRRKQFALKPRTYILLGGFSSHVWLLEGNQTWSWLMTHDSWPWWSRKFTAYPLSSSPKNHWREKPPLLACHGPHGPHTPPAVWRCGSGGLWGETEKNGSWLLGWINSMIIILYTLYNMFIHSSRLW